MFFNIACCPNSDHIDQASAFCSILSAIAIVSSSASDGIRDYFPNQIEDLNAQFFFIILAFIPIEVTFHVIIKCAEETAESAEQNVLIYFSQATNRCESWLEVMGFDFDAKSYSESYIRTFNCEKRRFTPFWKRINW